MRLTETFGQTRELLSAGERRRACWLVAAMLLSGVIETAGLTPVLPFLAVLAKPQVIQTNFLLHYAYETLHFTSQRGFLIFLGGVVLAAFIAANVANAWITWRCQRYALLAGHALSARLFRRYLAQPYVYFLGENSSRILVDVVGRVFDLVHGVLVPGLQVVSKAVLTLLIFGLLMAVNPWLSLAAAAITGGGYVAAYLLIRGHIRRYGVITAKANEQRGKFGTEALSGIKDVKVLGREEYFWGRYSEASDRYVRSQSNAAFLSLTPRYILEILAIGSMVGMVLSLLALEGDLAGVLPVLALYAFAAYRLMPAMQQVFQGIALIKFNAGSVAALYESARKLEHESGEPRIEAPLPALAFSQQIAFSHVSFSYPGAPAPSLQEVSFVVRKNDHVGLVGATGSGKSTALDLVLALLEPQSGSVEVDGIAVVAANSAAWRLNIGYVPQNIYLTDDTVARNIAFGLTDAEIDMARVEAAAKLAQIHDFVRDEMALGYATVVGERGSRLSGGQRQRIGIARALYRRPAVLVLDEASSALDSATEQAVIEGLKSLAGKTTILHVTHRLSTVRDCNLVLFFEQGRLVGQGTFDELYAQLPAFRALAP